VHYSIKGITIKTENAAKSSKQGSRYLINWLLQHEHVTDVLDYGCGKLRYTTYLHHISNSLTIVDSDCQLDRTQIIGDVKTSVREYAQNHWPGCTIYDLEQFWNGIQERFEFILCANVLSAIPSAKARAKSLRAIHSVLKRKGQLLVVNQHTNSYFTQMQNDPRSMQYFDGWISQSHNGGAYYGLLNKDKVIALLTRFGFEIIDAWIEDQSNYVLAGVN
jgi:SAM-dependent methyltransferase